MTLAFGMRAKWLPLVELRPFNEDGFVECKPIPDVLWLVDLPFEPPLIKPELTTVIELLLGPPPLDDGPTLLV